MTRILVLSDTHLSTGGLEPGVSFNLLEDLAGYIDQTDLIIHAGDHTGPGLYHNLVAAAEVVSVCGNMDSLPLQGELPERALIEREDVRIGIVHGWGSPRGLEHRVLQAWGDDPPDIMIFGHSHRAYKGYRGKHLLFNPGSPTCPRGSHPTAGWIELHQREFQARIFELPKHGNFP